MKIAFRTRAKSSTGSTGLLTYIIPPASKPAATSSGRSRAVTKTTGMFAVFGSPFRSLVVCHPSRPGIMMSMRIRSGCSFIARAIASCPLLADRVS